MMKKFTVQIANFIVEHNEMVATGGAIYASLRIGGAMLGDIMDPLSLIFVVLVLKLFYPLIHLVSGIIARVLKAAATVYLKNCGESVDSDYGYGAGSESYHGYGTYSDGEYTYWRNKNNYHEERRDSYDQKTEYGKNESGNGSNTGNGGAERNAGQTASDYDAALKYFGLKTPFTAEQLKAKRRKFMKTAHPDVGGSAEDAKKINRYYDVLKRYAA